MKLIKIIISISLFCTAFAQTVDEYYDMGILKTRSNDFQGALKDFNNAINLDSSNSVIYFNRAVAKFGLNDFTGALADLNKSLSLNPEEKSIYMLLGMVREKLEDRKGAIQALDVAIQYNPSEALAYLVRGKVKCSLGDSEGSCSDLKKAKELGQTAAESYLKQCCAEDNTIKTQSSNQEFLKIDWPDSEGWRVAVNRDDATERFIELLRNDETFENWTELGVMVVYKNLTPELIRASITRKMYRTFEMCKLKCPDAKLTLLEKNAASTTPWILFKVECASSEWVESQLYYLIQGKSELFSCYRAIKQESIPAAIQEKWMNFFKSSQLVNQ